MDPQRLSYMIEQIARNFEHASDPVQAVVEHIKDFWDPRMIAGLLSADHSALGPISAAAVRVLAQANVPVR